MSHRQFYRGLGLTALFTLLVLEMLYYLKPAYEVRGFSLIFVAIFVSFTVIMYLTGKKASFDKNPYKFSRAFLAFTFLKIMLSFLVIVAYALAGEVESRIFLISFLPIYLIFTVFETYVFMKLSKNQPETA